MNKLITTYILIGNLIFASVSAQEPFLTTFADVQNFVVDKKFAAGVLTAGVICYLAGSRYLKYREKQISEFQDSLSLRLSAYDAAVRASKVIHSECECGKNDEISAITHKCSKCALPNIIDLNPPSDEEQVESEV